MTSRSLVFVIGIALLVAAQLNGASFFLKRIGVWEAQQYQAVQHAVKDLVPVGSALSCAVSWNDTAISPGGTKPDFEFLYRTQGEQRLLKLAKELVVAALIIFLFIQLIRRPADLPALSAGWSLYLLAAVVVVSAFVSWANFGAIALILAGIRSFVFVPVALGGRSIAGEKAMASFAWFFLALALVQIPYVVVEAIRGLPVVRMTCLGGFELTDRGSGTFVHPNTLGVYMVLALFFFLGFVQPISRRVLAGVYSAVVFVLFLSGSATGFVVLLAGTAVVWLGRRAWDARWVSLALVMLGGVVAALPFLTRRPDVFFSVGGRLEALQEVLALADSPLDLLVGQGLGVCTGAAINFFRESGIAYSRFLFETDSTVSLLLAQTGLIGLMGYFGTLAVLFIRQRQQRAFYIAVMLSSLTLNVIEAFPLNIMLGLAMAAGLGRAMPNGKA